MPVIIVFHFGQNIHSIKKGQIGLEKRGIFLYVFLLLGLIGTIASVLYVNVQSYSTVSQSYNSTSITADTSRGTIYDCKKRPLVNSEYQYIAVVPPSVSYLSQVYKYQLSQTDISRVASGFPICVQVDADFESDDIPVLKVPKRYDADALCAHIIGYLDDEGNGVSGIEKAFNEQLTGGELNVYFKKDALGNTLAGEEAQIQREDYDHVGSVVLTIDKDIQRITATAANAFIEKGAVVVLENATGKIRAMCSLPDFSQNNLEASLNSTDSPFVNRALSGYNAGSVFKLCTAAAALEAGVSYTCTCKGYTDVGGVTFHCMQEHGTVDMQTALEKSCNVYFIELSQKLSATPLYNMAQNMGFGTSIELCDGIVADKGVLPELADIKRNPAALANFAFGQGSLLATPLQIASMLQCISNKGQRIRPSLIEEVTDQNGVLIEQAKLSAPTNVISEETAGTLLSYMVSVVENGTGKNAKPATGGAGGKTATAETGWKDENGNDMVQTWFAGVFPAKDPIYTVVVLSENGKSGSESAAPVFKKIADHVNALEHRVEPETDSDLEKK